MSPSPQLAPPGSSSYNSDTMSVGDGTWDAGRNTFLLPNLVGLNFATMQYNGMGNRFFTMPGYQGLVKAHGILAAITFLFIVPAAILIMRFYGANPRKAIRTHIWLQVLTLLLSTVVFAIGWFQVGPKRSLTNPHHGIGLALYLFIWLQVLGGTAIHRIERRRTRKFYKTLKAMLHHWLGRAIALLGIAQVALGLTLYGSPKFLFVLYALWVAVLIITYFALQWRHERHRARVAPGGHSEYSEEVITQQRPEKSHSGFGKLAAAGAAGVGLAALFNRKSKPQRRFSESDITRTSYETGSSYYLNEKPGRPQGRPGIGKRILEIGAIGGALAAAKSIFSRKKTDHDDDSDVGPYRPPLGGNTSIASDSISRLEEGRPPQRPVTPTAAAAIGAGRPSHPLAQPPMNAASGIGTEDYSYYSYESSSPSRQGRHQTFKQAVVAGGTMYAVRQLFKNKRQNKEETRAEELRRQRVEQENIARMNSKHKYTGDGSAPYRPRHNRLASQTASDVSSLIEGSVQRPGAMSGMSSAVPIAGGAGAAAASALADRNRIRPVGTDPMIAPPGPMSAMNADGPPPPPPPHGIDPLSSGSELYTTTSGQQRHRHHTLNEAAGAAAGAALGAAATDSRRRRQDGGNTDSMDSQPVSIHVKTQDNGRKVTLRRLTEEEAAAQRAARRAERRGSRRRRNSSLSSSGGEGLSLPESTWQRTERLETEQQAALDSTPRPSTSNFAPSQYPTPPLPGTQPPIGHNSAMHYNVPPPPPIPASTSNLGPAGSITSPGTETSGPSEYANNRRRRRAERAQARIAREGRTGGNNTVDFT